MSPKNNEPRSTGNRLAIVICVAVLAFLGYLLISGKSHDVFPSPGATPTSSK